MAVPEQTPYIEHTGNGVTTSFSLEFQCESKDHLIVLVDEIEPPIATWSLAGGNVVFATAPAAGKKITVQRNTPFSRTTDYQSYNNSFRPPSVNKDFDWIWLKLQELGVADWILGARINALKNYVDRKDDELKAYLMEEIRKQGVALDQLDEYYNYLMERLAQIAVDKGWDASFVVYGGVNQKTINDGLDSIAELLSIPNPFNGMRVFVKSYRPGIGLGSGRFVWDIFGDKAKHNGGTIIDPDRPFPSDWTNSTQVSDWFTAGTGTGVWKRIYAGEANAEDFGFVSDDTHDSQLIVQHIVDKVSSSNIPVTFRNGVALISKAGITAKTGLNATLENFKFKAMPGYETYDCVFKFAGCEKANIYFKGDSVVEMPQDEYTTGEWRHAFNFNGGSNIEVFYPKVNGTGGDAYYIANNTNIKLHKPVSLRSRRQGMSVISVNGLRVYNPEFHNTVGTTPQAGICIEPGNALGVLKDIVIESPVCNNNGGCGIAIYLEKLSASTYSGEPIEITINNPVTKGNAERGILVQRVYNDTVKYGGYININNHVSRNDKQGGIHVSGKDKDCAVVNIANPVVVDACENGTNYSTKSAVLITDFAALPVSTGGINITDIVTTDKNSKVDFAVNFDLSNGISDSTVTLASWKGATTAPIGFGSSTEVDPARAELSTIVFKTTKELTDKAYTSGFNTTKDSYSNVITNMGSSFDIVINLRWYPPKSLPLKFAVKTEKLITIKPLDTTDKIIGTSAAGQGVYSNIVGATAEIYYFGLINGVRLWRFVGDRDLWTFE